MEKYSVVAKQIWGNSTSWQLLQHVGLLSSFQCHELFFLNPSFSPSFHHQTPMINTLLTAESCRPFIPGLTCLLDFSDLTLCCSYKSCSLALSYCHTGLSEWEVKTLAQIGLPNGQWPKVVTKRFKDSKDITNAREKLWVDLKRCELARRPKYLTEFCQFSWQCDSISMSDFKTIIN